MINWIKKIFNTNKEVLILTDPVKPQEEVKVVAKPLKSTPTKIKKETKPRGRPKKKVD